MSSVEDLTSRFSAVSLPELVSAAALLTRVDRKYLIPARDAAAVLNTLDRRTRVLELDGERGCDYASVYFDTPDRLSYHLTARSRRRRFKLRTRAYGAGTDRSAYLEVKTRGGRGATVKERITCDPEHAQRLTPAGRAYAAAALSHVGLSSDLAQHLNPELTTRYRRTTLLMADGNRATVDAALEWIDADGRLLALEDFVIVESKSAGHATSLDHSMWRLGHRPVNISKFGTGTAALHPDLPANKWARLIRGPFAHAITDSDTDTDQKRAAA